jgi:hypothetical protein
MVDPGAREEMLTVSEPRIDGRRVSAVLAAFLVLMLATLVAALALTADAEAKPPGFSIFEATPSNTQAGGHPDVVLDFQVNVDYDAGAGGGIECETTHDCVAPRVISFHFPTGFIGNPHAAPTCTATEFNQASCPVDSQVGRVDVIGEEGGIKLSLFVPIYNMETSPDQAGLIGFLVPIFGVPVLLELSGRTDSDYGLDAVSSPQIRLPFEHFSTTLWGVPADPVHDYERFFTPLVGFAACFQGIFPGKGCKPGTTFIGAPTYAPPTLPETPYLQNPTTCGVPLSMIAEVEYYGGVRARKESPWPPTTGCSQASFEPSLTAKATTSASDSPSGLDTDLRVPQTLSPHTPSPSELRTAVVNLPPGFSINPNAADGKTACPDALSSIGTLFAATCPEFSKVGSLSVDVSALPAPIPGALYLAEPKPGEPYRVLIAADGFATHVKLLGTVLADPTTGRLQLVFKDLPQAPLQEFDVHVFGSDRGLLATPTHCGTYAVESEFVPWNNTLNTRFSTSFITIDSGPNGSPCPEGPRAFSPSLSAGTRNNTAGMYTPFSLTLSRHDGDQYMTGASVGTPPGFAAKLKGVAYCPQAAIDRLSAPNYSGASEKVSPACPPGSVVGSVVAAAGSGTHPVYVTGKAYLAGPYRKAPLSLVVVIPAVSGPYDLGVVSTRVALEVDPATARVTAVPDRFPQILGGIPLRTRFIQAVLDRPDFTLNPTNCDPSAVESVIAGDEGATARPTLHFQVADCTALNYSPKLSLRLTGGVKRRGHPAIHAIFEAKPGEANTRRVSVALPKGELLDNSHIGTVCTRVQFASDACPAASVYGSAQAETPILDEPLRGTVYLRSSSQRLPDLVVDLEGQIDLELVGTIDSVKGRLRSTFKTVPDAPVGKFRLDLFGGKKGLVTNSRSLCGTSRVAVSNMTGQNGAEVSKKVLLDVACASDAKRRRRSNPDNARTGN